MDLKSLSHLKQWTKSQFPFLLESKFRLAKLASFLLGLLRRAIESLGYYLLIYGWISPNVKRIREASKHYLRLKLAPLNKSESHNSLDFSTNHLHSPEELLSHFPLNPSLLAQAKLLNGLVWDLELLIKGWSFHEKSRTEWEAIVICEKGHVLASESKKVYRKSVRKHFQGQCSGYVGFHFRIGAPIFAKLDSLECFALYESGKAYPFHKLPNVPKSNLVARGDLASQISWKGKIYRVVPEQPLGYLEEYFFGIITISQFNQLINNYPNALKSSIGNVILKTLFQSVMEEGDRSTVLDIWSQYQQYTSQYLPQSTKAAQYFALFTSVSVHAAQQQKQLNTLDIAPIQPFSFQLPKVYRHDNHSARPWKHLSIPAERIYQIINATVYCESIVTKDGNYLILDPSAAPQFDFIAGYRDSIVQAPHLSQYCAIYGQKGKVVTLDRAILLAGRCAANYFHWLIEYLPRLASLSHFPKLAGLPILVPSRLPTSMIDALKLAAPNQPIFFTHLGDSLEVRDLYVPSMMTFQPDTLKIPLYQGAALSFKHLAWLRNHILSSVNIPPDKPKKKVLLYRPDSLGRGILNFPSLAEVYLAHGFELVDPSTLSFTDQVILFASASAIAGCGGAAFANIIFCSPGTQIISMVMQNNVDYSMESNLATFAHCSYVFLTGPSSIPKIAYSIPQNYVHSPFWIPVSKLKQLLHTLNL